MYAPVRHHEFVNFDDSQYVSQNPEVTGGLNGRAVSWALTTGHAGNWHPLTWLSHLLDVELFGLDPGRHHLTSVALHLANTLLLFGLLFRMTGALFRSAFVAALFALHPLHVESVAWIAERKDVLSALFFLLTLSAHLAYVRRPGWSRYVLVVVLFALGLMAKPMLVTLPFVLLLLDFWPLGRAAAPSAWRRLIVEKLPLLALAIASSLVTLLVQQRAGAIKGLDLLPLSRRLATAVLACVWYAAKVVWPTHLAALYPYPAPVPSWQALGALAVLAAVSLIVLRAAPRQPYLPVGWFWFIGTLVPVLGLVQVGSQPWADRYTYIPVIGLFIVVAWGAVDLLAGWRHRHVLLAGAAALVLVACAIAARRQVGYWRSSVVLWEHALEVTTANHRAESNLAHALAGQRRLEEAVAHYSAALRIKPDFAEAHNNLGLALAEQGQGTRGHGPLRRGLARAPRLPGGPQQPRGGARGGGQERGGHPAFCGGGADRSHRRRRAQQPRGRPGPRREARGGRARARGGSAPPARLRGGADEPRRRPQRPGRRSVRSGEGRRGASNTTSRPCGCSPTSRTRTPTSRGPWPGRERSPRPLARCSKPCGSSPARRTFTTTRPSCSRAPAAPRKPSRISRRR